MIPLIVIPLFGCHHFDVPGLKFMEFVKSTYVRSIRTQIIILLLFGLVRIAPAAWAGNIDDVRASVYAWCKSWQNRDIDTYMAFYSRNFRANGLDYRSWMKKKKRRFKMVRELKVDIFGLGVFIEGESAVASFIQRYQDAKISNIGEKTLTMIHAGGKWKIVSETWKPLKAPTRLARGASSRPLAKKIDSMPAQVGRAKKKHARKVLSKGGIVVKSIRLELQKKPEKLFVASNKYFVPKILTLDGDHPKIVFEIKPVFSWNGPYRTPANGNLIRQVRTYMHPGSKTLSVVLDLKASQDYHINQIYYEKKNVYCIEIR